MKHPFIEELEHELEYFSERKVVRFYSPATEESINAAEKALGFSLSPQMRFFFRNHNGGRILEMSIQGIPSLGLKQIPKDVNIVNTNELLQRINYWNPCWLHIGSDGFGNYFVAEICQFTDNSEYPIYLIDHEQIGNNEFSIRYAENYFEFLSKIVAEMKRIYTPKGELKDYACAG